jgi:hypothetical protein
MSITQLEFQAVVAQNLMETHEYLNMTEGWEIYIRLDFLI